MSSVVPIATAAIVVWGIVQIVKMSLGYEEKKRKEKQVEGETTASRGRIEALEERIRVLESIVTDKAYDLKQKISSL